MVEIDRKTMERALKDQCVPTLRLARFKGSFPNFYREDDDFIALVNFQFSLSGGSFCVNLSLRRPRKEKCLLPAQNGSPQTLCVTDYRTASPGCESARE